MCIYMSYPELFLGIPAHISNVNFSETKSHYLGAHTNSIVQKYGMQPPSRGFGKNHII